MRRRASGRTKIIGNLLAAVALLAMVLVVWLAAITLTPVPYFSPTGQDRLVLYVCGTIGLALMCGVVVFIARAFRR